MLTFRHFAKRTGVWIRQRWEVLSVIAIGLGVFLFFVFTGNGRGKGPDLLKVIRSINEKHVRERESLEKIHEDEIASVEEAVRVASETFQKLDEDHEKSLSSLESRKIEEVRDLETSDADIITQRLKILTSRKGDSK